jgi:hypothetical protein
MDTLNWRWPVIITISAAVTQVLAYSDVTTLLRPAIVLWFLLICPGMAFIRLLQFKDWLQEAVLAMALSLALDLIVAASLLYAGFWSPEAVLNVLIVLSLVGVLCQPFVWFHTHAPSKVGQS